MTAADSVNQPPASRVLRGAQEAVLLALVVATPWPFGTTEPVFEFGLAVGVALLLLLTSARFFLEGVPTRACPVLLTLAALVLFTTLQLVPLAPSVGDVVSPHGGQLWRDLLPDEPE